MAASAARASAASTGVLAFGHALKRVERARKNMELDRIRNPPL
ncbi:MAG: hypothetical protein ACI9KE_006146 [Polyangiales bacterium]